MASSSWIMFVDHRQVVYEHGTLFTSILYHETTIRFIGKILESEPKHEMSRKIKAQSDENDVFRYFSLEGKEPPGGIEPPTC